MNTPQLDVRYIAKLARIDLTDEEIAGFQDQLGHILQYVEQLRQVDVSDVDATAHANPLFNVFRQDVSRPSLTTEEALANAPRQASDLFIVPQVIE